MTLMAAPKINYKHFFLCFNSVNSYGLKFLGFSGENLGWQEERHLLVGSEASYALELLCPLLHFPPWKCAAAARAETPPLCLILESWLLVEGWKRQFGYISSFPRPNQPKSTHH